MPQARDMKKANHPQANGEANVTGASKPPSPADDWDGPNDTDNPMNWPLAKKMYHTMCTGLLAFVVTFGSSIYTPAVPAVSQQFGVSRTVALLPLSLYVLSLGVGPCLAAPVSETHGRRLVYWIGVPISMLFTLGAGFSNSFAALCVCRFFAGMFGSPVLAVGFGSNSDIWSRKYIAVAVAGVLMSPFAGPAVGPFIGGYATMGKDWRWTQWVLLMFELAFFLPSLGMSETYQKIILKRRAQKQKPGATTVAVEFTPSRLAMLKIFVTATLTRPIHMSLTEPIVAFLSIYVAFAFAVLFAFFAAFPIVFQGQYGFNSGESGLTFLALLLGVIMAGIVGIATDRTVYMKKYRQVLAEGQKSVAPEHRLYVAMMGSVGIPIGLFWFAWTARAEVHWISCVLASIPFAFGNLSIFISTGLYLIDVYGPMTGASAMAANSLLRYVMGAAFPLFTVQMYERLGIGWATSLLGFISLAMLPIPWVLFRWGPAIRGRSAYVTLKD